MGADETQIEALFQEAIRIAKEQKSISLEKRAEATGAEYRRQKASGSGGRSHEKPPTELGAYSSRPLASIFIGAFSRRPRA